MVAQVGLEWVLTICGSEPRWTVEPSVETVAKLAHHHLGLSETDLAKTTISYRGQGALNKLYTILCPRGSFMMRVSLPVDPRFKTLSETATVELVRSSTSIPVPQIIAFDASSDNELGFEWVLMEQMPGNPLEEVWGSMSWTAKSVLVEQVADITAQLFRLKFSHIGNVFRSHDLLGTSSESHDALLPMGLVVDRIVSMPFFWDTHITQDVPRGPFPSSTEWLAARLAFVINDCNCALQGQTDPDDIEDIQDTSDLAKRLLQYLPRFYPPSSDGEEKYALHHDGISRQNILVGGTGNLTALVNWECVSVVPLWKVCRIPSFLDGPERHEKPRPELYLNGMENTLYTEHVQEFELCCLRRTFLNRMEAVEPLWVQEHQTSVVKADFGLAVELCDSESSLKLVKWLDSVDAGGQYHSLREWMQ